MSATTSWSSRHRCWRILLPTSSWRWYDEAAVAAGLDTAFGGEPIDLLIVDGPPAFAVGHGTSRYPALPVLHERLAPGATVVLDDIERPGEQVVLERWELEFRLTFERRLAGVAMATVGSVGERTGERPAVPR